MAKDMPIRSEQDILNLIHHVFPNTHPSLLLGRGDDCAQFSCPTSLCITTDLLIEDIHFRASSCSPQDIGHKALAVNLSDLAAMGATPLGFSLALTLPQNIPSSFWQGMLQGMADLAGEYDLILTGGDLSKGSAISICITAWGEPAGRPLQRGQTQVGDLLVVVGNIGMSRVGLAILEAAHKDDTSQDALPTAQRKPHAAVSGDDSHPFAHCLARHLRPRPLVQEGRILAGLPHVRGAMDISDGLDQDLPRFLAAGQGANLTLPPSAIHNEVTAYCRQQGLEPARFCLQGGEDYALLTAVSPSGWQRVQDQLPHAWKLGVVTEGNVCLDGKPLSLQGFDHFCQPSSPSAR